MVAGQDDMRLGLEEEKVGRRGGHRHLGGFIEEQQVEPGCCGLTRLSTSRSARRPNCIQVPPTRRHAWGAAQASARAMRVLRVLRNVGNARIEWR